MGVDDPKMGQNTFYSQDSFTKCIEEELMHACTFDLWPKAKGQVQRSRSNECVWNMPFLPHFPTLTDHNFYYSEDIFMGSIPS